jgi:hypothetical protein
MNLKTAVFYIAALSGAAFCGCASAQSRKTLNRMIDDCMRQGFSEDQCQQERGCMQGMTRGECLHTLGRSLDIWVN